MVTDVAGLLIQVAYGREGGEQITFDIQILIDESLTQRAVGRIFQQRVPGSRGLDDERALWRQVLR